ncbi:MAG: CotH kinase family protein [Eisenbergiella massiliensis]
MFKNEEYRRELTDVINTLRSDYLTPERVSEKVNSYKSVTKPYLYSMPDVLYAPLTEAEFEQVADNIPKEIEENYQRYLESLERPMPFYIGVPEPQEGEAYRQLGCRL